MTKKLTIKDFIISEYVSWGELEHKLGKERYKKLKEWLRGQTTYKHGIFVSDLMKFLYYEK